MKLSYNWLSKYLSVSLNPHELSSILTNIGLEVEGLSKTESVKGGYQGLVVGAVTNCIPHPNADKLKLTTVNIGAAEPLQIVCGANNVLQGQKVVVATIGTTLYPTTGEPFTIEKGKIRGELSMGMICAEDEIGLGSNHEGIIVLPDETLPGTPVAKVFNVKTDYIYEVALTANRSDANSHLGSAKDVAAYLAVHKQLFNIVQSPAIKYKNNTLLATPIKVSIESTNKCKRYCGVTLSGIQVGASPEWLRDALQSIDIKSINNIVDITNYIAHELGQPLHAFDAEQILGNKIVVTTLPQGTSFTTLDNEKVVLSSDDLIICDNNLNPMCIAGVYGGITSGVKQSTTQVFIESAYFEPTSIRKSKIKHKLFTDAASRFEKNIDPNACLYALYRAIDLILETAGGSVTSAIIDVYPEPILKATLFLNYKTLCETIGYEIDKNKVNNILTALEMNPVANFEGWQITIPTNKPDVVREIDVIEEVLRIYGLDNIPTPTTLKTAITHSPAIQPFAIRNSMIHFMCSHGYNQMMGLTLINSKYYDTDNNSIARINDSANEGNTVMRNTMLFSGLEAILYNQNRQNSNLQFFEFGKTYHKNNEKYSEQEYLALFISGKKNLETWRSKPSPYTFFDIKEIVDTLLTQFNLNNYQIKTIEHPEYTYCLQYITQNKTIATLGLVNKSIQKKFDIKNEVYFATINFDNTIQILKHSKPTFKQISKFPSVRRDLALILSKNISFGEIEQIAFKTIKNNLKEIGLFDVFEDEQKLGKDKKSYAINFLLQDDAKTLTESEIDKIMQKLIYQFKTQLAAEIRDK